LLYCDPTWSHDLLLNDQELKERSIGSKKMDESVSSLEHLGERRILSTVSDLKKVVDSIRKRHLKSIVFLYTSRPPPFYLRELSGKDFFELFLNISAVRRRVFRNRIHNSLNLLDLYTHTHILLEKRIKGLSKQYNCSIRIIELFIVSIIPEEVERLVCVER
jgi:hypothetical protein